MAVFERLKRRRLGATLSSNGLAVRLSSSGPLLGRAGFAGLPCTPDAVGLTRSARPMRWSFRRDSRTRCAAHPRRKRSQRGAIASASMLAPSLPSRSRPRRHPPRWRSLAGVARHNRRTRRLRNRPRLRPWLVLEKLQIFSSASFAARVFECWRPPGFDRAWSKGSLEAPQHHSATTAASRRGSHRVLRTSAKTVLQAAATSPLGCANALRSPQSDRGRAPHAKPRPGCRC